MSEPIQVIYVEASQLQATILRAGLSVHAIDVLHLDQGDERLLEEISRSRCDSAQAIVLNMQIGDLSGLQVARRLRAEGDSRPILVLSEDEPPSNSELMAIQAMFAAKPFDFDQ